MRLLCPCPVLLKRVTQLLLKVQGAYPRAYPTHPASVVLAFALRYFNDLWAFDLEELSWQQLSKPGTVGPRPRGGCQMVVHQVTLPMIGSLLSAAPDRAGGWV